MIKTLSEFEAITKPPLETIINNTPGAKLYPNNRIYLNVSRYQTTKQSGDISARTGVFYFPQHNSPYSSTFKSKSLSYGGEKYIESSIILKRPYIIQAGLGGNGGYKVLAELKGKSYVHQLERDVHEIIVEKYDDNTLYKVIYDLFKKYNGNTDYINNILVYHNIRGTNRLLTVLMEHIIACNVRKAGYDSILSYSRYKGLYQFVELYYLKSDQYPV